MKRKTIKLIATGFICVLSASLLNAQRINVVTTAVPFLRISPDARSGGMGDAGLATEADASSIFWNLAKIPFAQNNNAASITYTPWLRDLQVNDVFLGSVSGFHKLDDQQAISASLRYFSLGKITFTDFSGQTLFDGNPREFAFDAGYSRKLSDKTGLGVALRYIHSNLVGSATISGSSYKPGNAVAGDLSFYYNGISEAGSGWSFGAAATNLGSKISYSSDAQTKDYIPANLGVGTAYTKKIDDINKITFALDLNKLLVPTPNDTSAAGIQAYRTKSVASSWISSLGDGEDLKEITFSLGAEYTYNDQFTLRAGYFYEDKTKGNRKYFTVGAGLKYNVFGLNLSYLVPSGNGVNRNPLSNTLRFSLIFDLDNIGKGEGETTTTTDN
ncbi:MAG: type IX secretion system outer membrane channel protein PorV [Sphingobacteriales bacterium]|nr:type IX secretion system outer membrane channel protein PorV [Sphingobacteriales bacterium]MBI3717045.1 type IX secretion system outer membrane channel protein PorV [Sphingobacteriales bacterium]